MNSLASCATGERRARLLALDQIALAQERQRGERGEAGHCGRLDAGEVLGERRRVVDRAAQQTGQAGEHLPITLLRVAPLQLVEMVTLSGRLGAARAPGAHS
jgi:hypothetical protein